MRGPYGLGRAVEALRGGLSYGYPVCCVLNYALDLFLGIPAGISRGEKCDPELGSFVPCHYHKRVIKSLSGSDALHLINSGLAVEHLAPDDHIETRINGKVVSAVRIPSGTDAIFLSQLRMQDGN